MGFLWIGAAAFLMFLIQGMVYSRYWDRGLQAWLWFAQPALREGEQGELKEVVENRKRMPLPVLHVNLQLNRSLVFASQENTALSDQTYRRDVFSVLPYQRITRTLPFTAAKRGYYPCREVELVGRTLFFQGPFVKKIPQQAFLYVYPKAISMELVRAACQEMLGEYLWKKRLFEDPFSFQGIRDYEPHDSFRQVNWKAYGRTGQLKVNVFEHTAMAKAEILLNLKGDSIWTEEILLEGVIRMGAALAEQWIAMGVPVGLQTNGRDLVSGALVTVRSGAGSAHARTILQALSRIDLSKTDFRQSKEACSRDRAAWDGADRKAASWRRRDAEPVWLSDWKNSISGGMIFYVSCSEREEDVKQIEAMRQRGAQILWVRPVISRVAEERKRIYKGPVMEWRVEE
ncbi:MAG: DUF58 domain-containing protein [Lachnospiraceae bacterium]|nr:DUF58 domain-containing protein [Lachnospiraceae bacterium]